MKNWKQLIQNMITKMGFEEAQVDFDEEHRKATVFIYNQAEDFEKKFTPRLIENINKILHIVAQKRDEAPVHLDINNYRKEREQLIEDLAKASAKKATAKSEPIKLPPMNSYERRLVHVALAVHPQVETESSGIGKDRHVVVRPFTAE